MKASIRPTEVITPNAIQACAVSRVDFPPTNVILVIRLPLAVSDALIRPAVLVPSEGQQTVLPDVDVPQDNEQQPARSVESLAALTHVIGAWMKT